MIVSLPLTIVFALAALLSLIELGRRRGKEEIASYIADREAQATHAVMNGGMAIMFAPGYGQTSALLLQFVLGLACLILLARLVRGWRRQTSSRSTGTIYHLIGTGAMLWAVWVMDRSMTAMSAMPSSHDMHAMAPAMGGPSWLAMALFAVFTLDGLATALLAGIAPKTMLRMAEIVAGRPGQDEMSTDAQVRAVRLFAIPHCLMDAGMAAMLWPMAAG